MRVLVARLFVVLGGALCLWLITPGSASADSGCGGAGYRNGAPSPFQGVTKCNNAASNGAKAVGAAGAAAAAGLGYRAYRRGSIGGRGGAVAASGGGRPSSGRPPPASSQPTPTVGNRAGKDFTDDGRDQVYAQNLARNGGVMRCDYCGQQVYRRPSVRGVRGQENDAQVDHVYPKSRGGAGDPSNGSVACRRCNRHKSDKTLQDWDDELREWLE